MWAGLKATPGPRTRECSHRGLTPGLVGLRGTERPHPLLAPDTPITAPFLGVLCSTPVPQATPVFSSLLGRRFLCLLLGMVLMKEEHFLCRVESASSRRMSWGGLSSRQISAPRSLVLSSNFTVSRKILPLPGPRSPFPEKGLDPRCFQSPQRLHRGQQLLWIRSLTWAAFCV